MTTLQLNPAPLLTPTRWMRVSDSLWTANTGDDFVGTVERDGDRFVAIDSRGRRIGRTDDVTTAKRLVTNRHRDDIAEGPFSARDRRLAIGTAWVAAIAVAGTTVMLMGQFGL